MTQREFFTAIVNGTINPDIQAYAVGAIEKLNKRNATRSSKPTKSQVANAATMAEICNYLRGQEDVVAAEVAANFNITVQKASGLLALLVKDEKVTVRDIKIPKQGKRKAYTLVEGTTEEPNEEPNEEPTEEE